MSGIAWHYLVGDKSQGPVTEDQIRQLLVAKAIYADTLVWRESLPNWVKLKDTELAQLMTGSAVPPPLPDPRDDGAHFFPTSKVKLVVMAVATFGLYELYWFYKNWKYIKETENADISPFWRAWFSIFYCYPFFTRLKQDADTAQLPSTFNPLWQAVAFIALVLASRLPDPWWLVSNLSFIPLLGAQDVINGIHTQRQQGGAFNGSFTGWNIVGIVVGVLFWGLVLIGTFLPPEAPS